MALRSIPTLVGTSLALLAFVSAPAAADVFQLEGGRRVEGELVQDLAGTYLVRITGGATIAIPSSSVLHVETGPTPQSDLAQREARLPRGDANALCQLAAWCDESSFAEDAERLTWQALEIDPNHPFARRRLGFERVGNHWLRGADARFFRGEVHCGDGEWVAMSALPARLRERHGDEAVAQAARALQSSAGSGGARADALEQFRGLPGDMKIGALLEALGKTATRERQHAVRELGNLADPAQLPLLSRIAALDQTRTVRDEALRALKGSNHPDVALSFLPYLSDPSEDVRIHTANALSVFPDRRSAANLMQVSQAVWAGFGRVHISNIVQRAYVADYELVSGGTGNIVQEVADPVVETFVEGVVLDIAIRRVIAEWGAYAGALQRSTGQRFGANTERWASWWKDSAGTRALASQ